MPLEHWVVQVHLFQCVRAPTPMIIEIKTSLSSFLALSFFLYSLKNLECRCALDGYFLYAPTSRKILNMQLVQDD